VVVDGTSAAGGLAFEVRDVDVYYFSLQKGFAAEGGLTGALVSPAAVERIGRVAASGRYVPAFLDLATALDNSRKKQTYNTPSISTIVLAAEQVDWMRERFGRLADVAAHQREKASLVYAWAEEREYTHPFVADPAHRSDVVATIDLDELDQCGRRQRHAACKRRAGHGRLPQARAQPAPRGDVPRGRGRRPPRLHPLCRLGGGPSPIGVGRAPRHSGRPRRKRSISAASSSAEGTSSSDIVSAPVATSAASSASASTS
jgi:hypothetical protein